MKTHNEARRGIDTRACCTPDDMRDARRVADLLNIPFYVLNYAEFFRQHVIEPFAAAYAAGRTPNPCIVCNDKVKFEPMLRRAKLLGAEFLATGHYARTQTDCDGTYRLLRGRDRRKDQSYFLYRLAQRQLRHLMFPLGDMQKAEVRGHAAAMGLPVAEKLESQEICFVGAEGYAATVERVLGESPAGGNIVDSSGAVVGTHDGVHHFTLGQRRGLGIAAPQPLYVTGINAATREVCVGTPLLTDTVDLEDVTWTTGVPTAEERLWVQQRYREAARSARVFAGPPVRVVFDEPAPRGSPGQAAVIYRGDEVVGGGTIAAMADVGRRPSLPIVEAQL